MVKRPTPAASERESHYQIICAKLEDSMRSGALPQGTLVNASSLADRLGVSRSPVKRALQLLEERGLVRREGLRAWAVGQGPAQETAASLHLLDLALPESGTATVMAPSWGPIVAELETVLTQLLPFGCWQLSESEICRHFQVSRTVTREVLIRLNERGLISKNRASHWVAGPLSAQMLDALHDIRRLLEPLALRTAAPHLARARLEEMAAALEAALRAKLPPTPAQMQSFEEALHEELLEPARNQRLKQLLPELRLGGMLNQQFLIHVPRHHERAALREHILVLSHLLIGDVEGACGALQLHLDADHARARARLKVLSVFQGPEQAVPPYVTRVV